MNYQRQFNEMEQTEMRPDETESHDEEKVRLREFVVKYLALCDEYKAEVTINGYGVHCVASDSGRTFAFKTVYPEWDMVEDDRNEWDRDEEEES